VVTTAGSYNASAPLSRPGHWIMQMVAFREPRQGAVRYESSDESPTPLPRRPELAIQLLDWSRRLCGGDQLSHERCQAPGIVAAFAQVATSYTTFFGYGSDYLIHAIVKVKKPDCGRKSQRLLRTYRPQQHISLRKSISLLSSCYATPQTSQLAVSVPFATCADNRKSECRRRGLERVRRGRQFSDRLNRNVYTLAVGPTKNPGSTGTFSTHAIDLLCQ